MGTCEPDREPEATLATVVYCLAKDCHATAWYGVNDWAVDERRSRLITEGKPAMMAPYCPNHRHKPAQAA